MSQDKCAAQSSANCGIVLWALTMLLCRPAAGLAQPLPRDPVEDLREALFEDLSDPKLRRARLTKRAEALRTPGDLGRAAILHGWHDKDQDEMVADVDRAVKADVVKRF